MTASDRTSIRPVDFVVSIALSGLALLVVIGGLFAAVQIDTHPEIRVEMRAAIEALNVEDYSASIEHFDSVIASEPASQTAWMASACAAWRSGDGQDAAVRLQGALLAGLNWELVPKADCFPSVTVSRLFRIADLDFGLSVLYRRPDPADVTHIEAFQAAIDSTEAGRIKEALLWYACLNRRAGLTFLSALQFRIAVDMPSDQPLTIPGLESCFL